MGQEKESGLGRRIEPRDEIHQPERIAPRGHVDPALDNYAVGPEPEQTIEPGRHSLVPGGARNPRAESELGLDVSKGSSPVEFPGRNGILATAGEERQTNGYQSHGRAPTEKGTPK